MNTAPPRILGVLNVTPDSFSDGGEHFETERAIEHGLRLVADGADIVDVGGESTRPGAVPVNSTEEQTRVLDVVRALADAGVSVSIDTMHASTAERAVDCGAVIVNDVSGGRADPLMYATVARLGVPYVLMHWRGLRHDLDVIASYDDVVRDVCTELQEARNDAVAAGIDPDQIILDPGIGFAKDADHNWRLLANLDAVQALGHRILIGASRKRFLGALLADADGTPRPLDERDAATDAISAIAAYRGVWGVRVHGVRGTRDAVAVGVAWRAGGVT